MFLLDLGVIEFVLIVFTTVVGQKIFARRHFGGVGLRFAVVPGAVREEVLLVEGIAMIEVELVIIH